MANYSNPADKLSIIAAMPRTVLNPDITIEYLAEECTKEQSDQISLSKEEKQTWER